MSLKVCTVGAFAACVCVFCCMSRRRLWVSLPCTVVQALKKRMGRLGWYAAVIQTDNKESDSSATVPSFEGLLPSEQIGCLMMCKAGMLYIIQN